jgi:Histone chaperone Rttp106-like
MGRPHQDQGLREKSIDIQTVTAVDLAHYLRQERFEGDVAAAMAFVTDVLHQVSVPREPGAAAAAATVKHENNAKESTQKLKEVSETSSGPNSLGKSLFRTDATIEVTGVQPRSKFSVKFGQGGCEFVDAKRESIMLTANCVQHMVVFPKPEDCRIRAATKSQPPSTDLVLLVLAENSTVHYKKKPLPQFCWQLPATSPDWDDDAATHGDDVTAAWIAVLATALALDPSRHLIRIHKPAHGAHKRTCIPNDFVSYKDPTKSSTVSELPFVSCHCGVQDGVLFPTRAGLLFFKPPQFWHRSRLEAIECTGTNRYVTLTVQLHADRCSAAGSKKGPSSRTVEFTNISKEEQQGLRNYIHSTLVPAMQADVDDNIAHPIDKTAVAAVSPDEPDTAADDDDDDTLYINGGSRKRKAAAQAASINRRVLSSHVGSDDDDDDDDGGEFQADSASEDDDDGTSSEEEDNDGDANDNSDDDCDDANMSATNDDTEEDD